MARLLSVEEILENDGFIMTPDNPLFYQILHSATLPGCQGKVGIVRHDSQLIEYHEVDSPEIGRYIMDGELEQMIYTEYDDI